MAVFYGAVDLSKNELRQAQVQNLASAPASPVLGQIYYNTGDGTLYYCTNVVGPIWTAAKAGAGATPASTVTTQAIGDTGTVGTGSNFAREDHKHVMPSFGTVTAATTYGIASGNGSAATIARSDHTHGTPLHDAAAHAAISLSALAAATGPINFGSNRLTGVTDPSAFNDAATKNYVDNVAAGLTWKSAVRAATPGSNQALSGLLVVDGILLAAGDRVLVKDNTTASTNGIYVVASGAWTRATDADSTTEIIGAAVFVTEGSVNADTAWVMTANAAAFVVGSSNMPWAQFAGGGSVTAGAGLTQSGNTVNLIAGDTTLTVAADDVRVNTSVIATVASLSSYATTAAITGMAKKYAAALTGTTSPEVITHSLGTRDISLTVLNGASPYTAVEVDWDATSTTTATIRFSPALGAGYRVVVVG